jgi:hypothetical protein
METALLILAMLAVPIFLVGGLFFLVRRFLGRRALEVLAFIVGMGAIALLVQEASLPPAMGNEAAYALLGVVALTLITVISFFVLIASISLRKN